MLHFDNLALFFHNKWSPLPNDNLSFPVSTKTIRHGVYEFVLLFTAYKYYS